MNKMRLNINKMSRPGGEWRAIARAHPQTPTHAILSLAVRSSHA